ncbi:hypothetical protein ABZ826_37865 [Streptomyces sp. NPDC047515]|uniref:hypothetical protein n=1 Tax=Streptomyces sp. NPDC047515 TaxID=3155380 RepID=UPI00340A3C18
MSVTVMKRVPLAQAGMASATLNMLREIGGVVGVAALGAVLTSRLAATLTGSLDRLGVPPETRQGIADSVVGTGAGRTQVLPVPVHDAVNTAFVEGLHLALRCGGAAMATAAVLVAVLLRSASSQATEPADEPTQQDEPAYQ